MINATTREEMQNERLAFLKEHKCAEKGCFRWTSRGYIYCIGHLNEFPMMMNEEDIALLKKNGVLE